MMSDEIKYMGLKFGTGEFDENDNYENESWVGIKLEDWFLKATGITFKPVIFVMNYATGKFYLASEKDEEYEGSFSMSQEQTNA